MFSLKLYMLPNPLSHNIGCDSIRSGHTTSDQWQCEPDTAYPCGIGMISSCYYLFDCRNLTPEHNKLRRATTADFTIRSLFNDEQGIMALLDFARNMGLGYCRMVRCRTIPLDKDEEKMDEEQLEFGFDTFDG
jgi:hypothetical protein